MGIYFQSFKVIEKFEVEFYNKGYEEIYVRVPSIIEVKKVAKMGFNNKARRDD
jgi:hypothetical protein